MEGATYRKQEKNEGKIHKTKGESAEPYSEKEEATYAEHIN